MFGVFLTPTFDAWKIVIRAQAFFARMVRHLASHVVVVSLLTSGIGAGTDASSMTPNGHALFRRAGVILSQLKTSGFLSETRDRDDYAPSVPHNNPVPFGKLQLA